MKIYFIILLLLLFCTEIFAASSDEVTIIAQTLYAEARGESFKGKLAVATVIFNRAKLKKKSFKEICLQKKQFSCWNNKNIIKIKNAAQYKICYNIAKKLKNNTFEPINNWTNYYNPKKANPKWKNQLINKKKIGNHIFGKLQHF